MIPAFGSLLLLLQVAASTELGYRFTLPDGFVPLPAARAQADVVDCWTEGSGGLLLCVQRLHGTLGREGMRQADLPGPAQLVHFKWRGFDLDGVRTDTAESGNPIVIFAAQVPLRREAIQLIVSGPRDQAARVEAVLTATLTSLEGETNWLTPEQRSGRMGNIVGVAIGLGLVLIVARMLRARRAAAT